MNLKLYSFKRKKRTYTKQSGKHSRSYLNQQQNYSPGFEILECFGFGWLELAKDRFIRLSTGH